MAVHVFPVCARALPKEVHQSVEARHGHVRWEHDPALNERYAIAFQLNCISGKGCKGRILALLPIGVLKCDVISVYCFDPVFIIPSSI